MSENERVAEAFRQGEAIFKELLAKHPLDENGFNPVLCVLHSNLVKCGFGLNAAPKKSRKQKIEEELRASDLTAQLTNRDDIEYGHHDSLPRGEHVARLSASKPTRSGCWHIPAHSKDECPNWLDNAPDHRG